MKSLLLSFLERVMPRSSLAIILLIAASLLPAEIVGLYVWVTLIYGFTQSVFDAAVRQIAVEAVKGDPGFLKRYTITYSLAAPAIILGAIVVLAVFAGPIAYSLLPFIFAPVATAISTTNVARLQLAGRWKELAKGQFYAALGSLVISVPTLLITGQIWVAAFQILLSESINVVWILVISGRLNGFNSSTQYIKPVGGVFASTSAYSTLSWAQSQGDRLLVGLFAGTSVLANYNFSNSISRTGAAALGSASANVLRTKLVSSDEPDHRVLAERISRSSLFLALIIAIGATVASVFVLPHFLDESWEPALHIVPILAGGSLFTVLSYLVTVVLVTHRRVRGGIISKIVGVLLSIPVAISATYSLELASIFAWARELISLLLLLVFAREFGPWRATCLTLPVAFLFLVPTIFF